MRNQISNDYFFKKMDGFQLKKVSNKSHRTMIFTSMTQIENQEGVQHDRPIQKAQKAIHGKQREPHYCS